MPECLIDISFLRQDVGSMSAEETDRQASSDATVYEDDLFLVD
jgi:hypothetical protein